MTNESSEIINHILSGNPFLKKVNISELYFDESEEGYLIATSVDFTDIDDEHSESVNDERLIFNLPVKTPHIFVIVTNGESNSIARLLANLEKYERAHSSLSLNSFIALEDDDFLSSVDKVGAIFLPLSDSYFLKNVEPVLKMASRDLHLMYVVFINSLESKILHSDGRESLFDLWYEAGRGITSVTDGLE